MNTYTFSSKLKTFSFILMALGFVGIVVGFLNAPKTIEDVEKILADTHHHEAAHVEKPTHDVHTHAVAIDTAKTSEVTTQTVSDSAVAANKVADTAASVVADAKVNAPKKETVAHDANHDKGHAEHVLHQLQNKPWAALYVACIFFMLISVGVLAFYAIQYASQAGWSPILYRVMEGITAYLLPGSIIFFILLVLSSLHFNHLFAWMNPDVINPEHVDFDKLIFNKKGWLNATRFLITAALFLGVWNYFRFKFVKNSLEQDTATDNAPYKRNFKLAAAFLVIFIVTESIMSWDWIMSVDPHWYSTLFGWYVFASFFVSGITVIALVTIYLKTKGYLPNVNTSHIHDLAKFMFGLSIFWTYLWFSQFMLIWYSNIPEEVTYFVTRIQHYNFPFFGMLIVNFIFPLLILINTDFKRLSWIVVLAGVLLLFGHYIDFFVMIMPATVGDQWFIGIPEIGALMFFLGLFIFIVFNALTKAPIEPKGNPFIEESKHFHY
ncbi:quinol:cytochrome C oxidoreductase [Flavobacterium psychraquaticum]|uniref:quinol:cytochrome C oxidoreductase n=1 Tax=Flavobacterium psychraquaticum TaxID=3103958 RepID=UPI002ACDDD7E|nr:quinol:cytochrome C oxidoreductase [Flavobacterium sp. LB-N7T]